MIDFVHDDVLNWCKNYRGAKFHALLCDPPYHLGDSGFMNKHWDSGKYGIAFNPETWEALAEHLHDGAFIMAFSGARTYHRMACAIEDAGFVLHSMLAWSFGSGFPKATRIDTQIDKAAGAEREKDDSPYIAPDGKERWGGRLDGNNYQTQDYGKFNGSIKTLPATPLAATWQSHRYGLQALKPAMEPICVAQKPYGGRPVDCITQTGAGALNIDSARIGSADNLARLNRDGDNGWKNSSGGPNEAARRQAEGLPQLGRWPANFVISHSADCEYVGVKRVKGTNIPGPNGHTQNSESLYNGGWKQDGVQHYADADGYETVQEWRCSDDCAVRLLGEQSGELKSGALKPYQNKTESEYTQFHSMKRDVEREPSTGTAARFFFNSDWQLDQQEAIDNAAPFFYAAKASTSERNLGIDGRNTHSTVKPLKLSKYLASLLGIPAAYAPRRLLNPFGGSGTESLGAYLSGHWDEITYIERESEYVSLAQQRYRYWQAQQAKQQPALLEVA